MERFDPARTTRRYPAIYRNLMSVGLLGTIYRVGEDAKLINATVEMTLEEPRGFQVYLAVALAMAGQSAYAYKVLGARVEAEPQDGPSKLAFAVALLFSGDPQWRHWIDNVLATSDEQPVREAALGVMAYLGRRSLTH